VTVTVDRSFLLRLNRRTLVDIPLPYTRGMWEQTKPVTIALKERRNTLQITIKAPNKGLTIKSFTLTPVSK
jgi:DNA-directed RNA polymerase subunit K/omega